MGRTKALVPVHGVPMAGRVATALREGGIAELALVGGDADELRPLGLPVVADAYPGEGPVGGVLTAMRHFRGRSVLVMPCDVPYLDALTVEMLKIEAGVSTAQVIVAHADRLEPMCALWRPGAVEAVQSGFDGGERALHAIVADVDSRCVQVSSRAVRNMNRPEDLDDR